MKAIFSKNRVRSLDAKHRPDNSLIGQSIVIDCNRQKRIAMVDLYQKGRSFYCCMWVTCDLLDAVTSGKGKSRFDAFCEALYSTGITFDCPIKGPDFDSRTYEVIEPIIEAIATASGVQQVYVHSVSR